MDGPLAHITSFVGRASTIELVRSRLIEHRLVSLVGPGGCGKTRLALEFIRQSMGLQDCAAFVDLSGLSDPALVPDAVTRALGLREVPGQDPLETLSTQLSKRELLLLLDNCEHLVEACAALAIALARDCPGVRILATICERLDGIPLALELAAAQARMMSLGAIAEALSDPFDVLVGSERAGAARHQTLLASIEWSCGLLSDKERAVLYRLSVFASGFTLGAAKAVATGGEIDQGDVFGLLSSLVDKSLVEAQPRADRFRLHETMRAYAAAGLEASGAAPTVRDRHLDYFSVLTKTVEPKTWTSEFVVAVAVLTPELDNLRAALEWAVGSKQFDAGARLLSDTANFFALIGVLSESLAWCQRFLVGEVEPRLRADVLYWASVCTQHSDPAVSQRYACELIALSQQFGDDGALARGLCCAACIQAHARPDEGRKTAQEAVRLAEATGQHHILVNALQHQASACNFSTRPEEAFRLAEKAVEVARELDLLWDEMWAREALGWAARMTGRLERSLEEAMTSVRASAVLPGFFAYFGESAFAQTYMYLGDPRALDAFARARDQAEALGQKVHAAGNQGGLGHALISRGREDEGYEVLEEATVRVEALGRIRVTSHDRAVMAEVALRRGDLALARLHLSAWSSQVQPGDEPEVAALRAEARLARAEGELRRAHALACDGLEGAARGGQLLWVIDLLELVAVTVADLEHFDEAARLLGAAERQREITKYARFAPVRHELEPVMAQIEAALGKELSDQALCEGRGLDLEDAVAYARRGRGRRGRAVSGWESLTPSERRVADLVGQHLSNAEIAERLFISTTTVASHLNRVFAKLGVTGRAQLAAVVHDRRASQAHSGHLLPGADRGG
jgi:predicted ATPase/DNA-binding CsgD family transcriptional regulator